MRKYLVGFLTLALGVGVAGMAFGAIHEAPQSLTGKITPSKLDKKSYKNGKLVVRTTLEGVVDGGAIPQKATRVVIDFSKNGRINTNVVARCKASLEGTTREAALDLCLPSKVSKDKGSFASAALPFGPGGSAVLFDTDVIGFNGPKSISRSGASVAGDTKGSLILWTRVNALSVTTLLPSALEKAPGKKFRDRLNVMVPPLAGGIGAIVDFQVTTKRGSYIEVRCKADQKKNRFKGTFTYSDAPKAVVRDSTKIKKCNKNK